MRTVPPASAAACLPSSFPGERVRIGVDLGGTKIEAIALADSGEIAARERVPTPRSYEGTLEAIALLVRDVERVAGAGASVGIGIPGAVTPSTGLVKNANSVWLIGKPLGRDLESRLGRPVRIENDANCFAISEAADGAAAGADVVFGVILGTGVGRRNRRPTGGSRRPQPHRRRVGPQSAAVDDG